MVQNVQPNSNNNNNANGSQRYSSVANSPGRPNTKRFRPPRSPMSDLGLSNRRPSSTNNTLRKSSRKLGGRKKSLSQESQDGADHDIKTMGDDQEISMDEEAAKQNKPTRPAHSWQLVKVPLPSPPSNETSLTLLYELVTINKNMVIDGVTNMGMAIFLFGDQIHEINECLVNTRKHFDQAVMKLHNSGTPIVITVIRPWNVRCAPAPIINRLAIIDEKMTYFIVRVFRFSKSNGFSYDNIKRKVLITEIRPKTCGSYAFLIWDHVLGIMDPGSDNLFEKKRNSSEVQFLKDCYRLSMRTAGYTDFFVARTRDAHTAPNASIHGDVQTVVEKTDWGNETPAQPEKKSGDTTDPPLESDAVEIALRELYRLRLLTQTIDDGSIVVPKSQKGKSLLRPPRPHVPQQHPSSSGNSCNEKSGPVVENSLYEPYAKMPKPTKKSRSHWGRKSSPVPVRQTDITLKETHESSQIMSDIPDEIELKKVDADSGISKFVGRILKFRD